MAHAASLDAYAGPSRLVSPFSINRAAAFRSSIACS